MPRPGYRNSAQKQGRSVGQRRRRMANERKRANRDQGVYKVSIDAKLVENVERARFDSDDLSVFGVYKNEDGDWELTGMAGKRTQEKTVSDRQGAVKSKTIDQCVVKPDAGPEKGFTISTHDSKKEAMKEINAKESSKHDTGQYVIGKDDESRNHESKKIDRSEWKDWVSDFDVHCW